MRSDQQNYVHLSFAPVANKNTVTSQRDGGMSILKYLFAFIFWYNLSIFTLQQIANAGAAKVDCFVNLWYNISKVRIVRIGNIYYFVVCFAPNNIVKGCVLVAVNDM